MSYLCILGRQPALGLAELESSFNNDEMKLIQRDIAMINPESTPDFNHFGGILKSAQVLETLNSTDWNRISDFLQKKLPGDWQPAVGGKLTFGISTYGFNIKTPQINASALSLKKKFKSSAHFSSVRVVPNKSANLNTAQVLHNKLTGSNGLELLIVRSGSQTIIAQCNWVQDIEAYRRRDQERPMRDSRVGMLPPKLAQIIINLAAGGFLTSKTAQNPISLNFNETGKSPILLDPFCGTGVILQEAILGGYQAYGTDLDKRMTEYSQKNLVWLNKSEPLAIEQADATSHQWQNFNMIACETYLGRPFSAVPDSETLQKVVHDVNIIHKKFLKNVARQTKPGFRMCIAVPAWHVKSTVKHLPVLDHLEELGYNRVSFVHAKTSDLIYHREGQIVGRELVVLTRK